MTLEERLEILSPAVFESWGIWYPIHISKDETTTAAMNFREFFFHPSCQCLSDEELIVILLHECGHRTRAPGSHKLKKEIFEVLTSDHNIKPKLAFYLIHLATDLIVDRTINHSN